MEQLVPWFANVFCMTNFKAINSQVGHTRSGATGMENVTDRTAVCVCLKCSKEAAIILSVGSQSKTKPHCATGEMEW